MFWSFTREQLVFWKRFCLRKNQIFQKKLFKRKSLKSWKSWKSLKEKLFLLFWKMFWFFSFLFFSFLFFSFLFFSFQDLKRFSFQDFLFKIFFLKQNTKTPDLSEEDKSFLLFCCSTVLKDVVVFLCSCVLVFWCSGVLVLKMMFLCASLKEKMFWFQDVLKEFFLKKLFQNIFKKKPEHL